LDYCRCRRKSINILLFLIYRKLARKSMACREQINCPSLRFEEAYENWQARRLTQEEAARLLGVCERTFQRYLDRYEEAG
jgi:ActR/RegA family two-component response regulator